VLYYLIVQPGVADPGDYLTDPDLNKFLAECLLEFVCQKYALKSIFLDKNLTNTDS
jgi:hypothetical protein